jgi:hypothetical protein
VKKNRDFSHFFIDHELLENMASSANVPNMEDRFSTLNTDVTTQRVLFDVAAIPTGPLFPSTDAPSDEDEFSANLRRCLFGDSPPSLDGNDNNVTTRRASVTVDSSQHNTVSSELPSEAAIEELDPTRDIREEEVAASLLDIGVPPARMRRYQFSYSKKYFWANNALYYQLKPSHPPPEDFPELLGQVVQCPNKNNDYHYQINWLRPKTGSAWPANLTAHLRCLFPKDELHAQLPF